MRKSHLINDNQIMKLSNYMPPCTEVVKVQHGGMICQSVELNAALWEEDITTVDVAGLDF